MADTAPTVAHRVIAIAGSAGALAPLLAILEQLTSDLDAAVLVVIHTPPDRRDRLTQVICRRTRLRCATLSNAPTPLETATLYVAPADRHLRVTPEGAVLTREPREHHARPAADVLFRSASRTFGSRVTAVILSGYGGDGSTGALAVRSRGGTVIVQDPTDAEIDSMPRRATQTGAATHVLRAAEIATWLRQTRQPTKTDPEERMSREEPIREHIARDIREQESGGRTGKVTTVTCADCGGVLWQDDHGEVVDFTCHIGHRWTSDTLLVQKTEQLEAALLEALRLLKEKAMLTQQTAVRARERGHHKAAERLEEHARLDRQYAQLLQRELIEAEPSPLINASVADDVSRAED